MPWGASWVRIRASGVRFLCFATVGVSNTLVDVAVTNALILLLGVTSGPVLLLISIAACTAATLNSYVLNQRWTFRDANGKRPRGAVARFFAVAMVSMVVNTSTFLFLARYLPDRFQASPLVILNVAKLWGIAAAFAVSFLGYRFGVFQTEAIRDFRATFRFSGAASRCAPVQYVVLVTAALILRAGYAAVSTAIQGDAVSYSWVADSIAAGDFGRIEPFWNSLFCYWQALLRVAGFAATPAVILSSLIPGVLIVVPVVWLSRALFGGVTAWVAGILCVAHPRLIEYSCNGYPESLYVLAFAAGTAFLTRLLQRGGVAAAIGWGACMGAYTCVRNEGILVFLVSLALVPAVLSLGRRRSRSGEGGRSEGGSRKKLVAAAALSAASFAVVIASYGTLSWHMTHTLGFFQKISLLTRQYQEQLDPRLAARETYAPPGAVDGVTRMGESSARTLARLVLRVPRSVVYSLERLPGILMSPIAVFALLFPVFASPRGRYRGEKLPLLLMLFFPLFFYPLIQVEPRLFFPMLVPIHVLGGAGLVAFSGYVTREIKLRRVLATSTTAIALLSVGLASWRAVDLERNYDYQRALAGWVRENVPPNSLIAGGGYGYAATTGFLAGRRTLSQIWTTDPAELARFAVAEGAEWIVLYERYLELANPELLPVLDRGLPGFEKVFEVRDYRGLRSQILRGENSH